MKMHNDKLDNCIVCGANDWAGIHQAISDFEYQQVEAKHRLIQCSGCGLIRLDPIPTLEMMASYYPSEYANIHTESHALQKFLVECSYKKTVDLLGNYVKGPVKALDVGCAGGHFIGYLKKVKPDWQVEGVDLSKDAVEFGAKHGRLIHQGTLEQADLPADSFDLIIMSHLIEHVENPKTLLLRCAELLKSNGVVYIETPNTSCFDFKLFGRFWGGYHYPRHTHLFNYDNLIRLQKEVGFVLDGTFQTDHMFGWALSVDNILCKYLPIKKRNGRSPFYSAFMLGFWPILAFQKTSKNTAGMATIAHLAV